MGRPRRTDQTSRELRREIERGRFHGTSVLPGERQLATLLQVSRTTVRRALADLIEDGLVSQRHGMGTFITGTPGHIENKPIDRPLDYFGMNGRVNAVVEVSRERADPTTDEVLAFGLDPEEDVVRITRLTRRRDTTDALEYWSAPGGSLPDLSALGTNLAESMASQGHVLARRLRRLRVVSLDPDEALHLGVLAGSQAIRLDEHHLDVQGRCRLLNRAYYPAERFDAVFR